MKLGYIGLGKMGFNMTARLLEKGYSVVAFDVEDDARQRAEKLNGDILVVSNIQSLVSSLDKPRLIWIMVPHRFVDDVLTELAPLLARGDVLIDGGNSFYEDSMRRAKELNRKGINFLDVGVSGGPNGAKNGACLMIGGRADLFKKYEGLFRDLAAPDGYAYLGESGAGHFVKMIHNGIEYGMMQAIAEGFTVMKKSNFKLDLAKVADVYNHQSVIESRLIGWLKSAFDQYGEDLAEISGAVSHSGEGEWTVTTAHKLNVRVPIIEGALKFRIESHTKPSYTGKIVSALRHQFGGHYVFSKNV